MEKKDKFFGFETNWELVINAYKKAHPESQDPTIEEVIEWVNKIFTKLMAKYDQQIDLSEIEVRYVEEQ